MKKPAKKSPKKTIAVKDLKVAKGGAETKGGLKTEWITSVASRQIAPK